MALGRVRHSRQKAQKLYDRGRVKDRTRAITIKTRVGRVNGGYVAWSCVNTTGAGAMIGKTKRKCSAYQYSNSTPTKAIKAALHDLANTLK